MTEFYEPMLYMSTPEHPNTMGVLVTLKERIDDELLCQVVHDLRKRFPYFYVKAMAEGNDLRVVSNPLPMVVRESWNPIRLNSSESNYHLASWKYEGKRIAFEISHSLTDGAGVLPYIKSAMFLYLSRKTGLSFDRAGFRLPGDLIPDSEVSNPFEGFDIDSAEPPVFLKQPIEDFYRFKEETNQKDHSITYIRLSESQLMKFCRDYDGSPNAFLSVMFARAIRHYDPQSDKTISISVAIDHKAMLGNHDNYRMFANVIELDFPKDRSLNDLAKTCTIIRGQMMLQASKENSLYAMKMRKATYAKLDQTPLEMKTGIIAKSAGRKRWSVSISYANSRSFGPLDPYIDEFYLLAEPGVSDIICEGSCINQHFYLAIGQTFPAMDFIHLFLDELASVGLDCEIVGNEPFHLCGMMSFEAPNQ